MRIFNKRGDTGDTSLLFGRRVPKHDSRCEAYGTIDEAVSSLGIAYNFAAKNKTKETILRVQKELFTVCAELATKVDDYGKFTSTFKPVTGEMVNGLEKIIDEIEAEIEMPKSFVIPGSNVGSAWLDLSRAIVRRAERRVVMLREKDGIENDAILQYLNRLADVLFCLARYEET